MLDRDFSTLSFPTCVGSLQMHANRSELHLCSFNNKGFIILLGGKIAAQLLQLQPE
jgi:hypothetical protein